ncbi:MAG: Ig-like domain-containing protein [Bacteroidota bacterium]
MQRIPILFCFFLVATTLLLHGCANIVSPTGGPKDVTPPRVLSCEPPFLSKYFKGNSCRIDFNEFITLKNPATEVYISPPLKTPLDTRLRGKSMIVKFENPLDSNTTYSITFGNAIADLTEGNILKGFNYVFSTGSYVDSLSLQGSLVNAFDLKPQKDIFVELYMNNNDTLPFDSLPLKVAPYYITKTDENGHFQFKNLQDKKFKLFALADLNGDLIFNQLSEKIAFSDSLVKPYYVIPKHVDTTAKDTSVHKKIPPPEEDPQKIALARKNDSLRKADSLKHEQLLYPSVHLYMFEETDSIQKLVKSTFPKDGMAIFKFRFPVKHARFVPLNFDSITPWHLEEFSKQRDSVTLWITRPKTDSLILKVIADGKTLDTVTLSFEKKELSKRAAKKVVAEQLTLSNPAKTYGLNQFKDKLILTFSYPLARWDFSSILLVEEKDTLHAVVNFTDSLKRNILVTHKWKEEKNYTLIFPDSIFFGLTNLSQDTIRLAFRSRAERDFGNLVLTMKMENRPGQYILQLVNEKETTLYEEQIVNKSGKVSFNYLVPGQYKIKAIHDRNLNGHWDTGNYRMKIQPEEVLYFPKIIDIKANWDVEEDWD